MNEISMAEQIASLVEGHGEHFEKSVLVSLMARMPVYRVAKVEALAKLAGESRNSMLNMLVGAGIEQVQSHIDSDVGEKLLELESEAWDRLAGGPTESGEV